jgi:hypothetical protein
MLKRAVLIGFCLISGVALSNCASKTPPRPKPALYTFDASAAAKVTPEPSPGTPVAAKGTYPLAEGGKRDGPRLTPAQIAWAKRIETSVVYRNHVARLRYIPMQDAQTPMVIYDSCGGGWGETRDCSLPADMAKVNETYHVIGGSCNYLLMVAGSYGGEATPITFAGRDPRCDILPATVSEREDLDESFNKLRSRIPRSHDDKGHRNQQGRRSKA